MLSSWRLLQRLRTKANGARSSEQRLHAISLFPRKNFLSKFGYNISLMGMNWRLKFVGWYKNITLEMLLLHGNKSGNSFNFYLQKSIARWEPSLKSLWTLGRKGFILFKHFYFQNAWTETFARLFFCCVRWSSNNVNTSEIIIIFIIFWDFLILQSFISPQVKSSLIISNKQCIYELPHKSPNDLSLRILGN